LSYQPTIHKKKVKTVEMPSKKEIKKETEKIKKIYECYRYLVANAGSEVLRKKIEALAQEHILSKVDEVSYAVELPAMKRRQELEELLKKAKEKEKKKS
jgi:hypothetical protein